MLISKYQYELKSMLICKKLIQDTGSVS